MVFFGVHGGGYELAYIYINNVSLKTNEKKKKKYRKGRDVTRLEPLFIPSRFDMSRCCRRWRRRCVVRWMWWPSSIIVLL
jgi:hypothetical protein